MGTTRMFPVVLGLVICAAATCSLVASSDLDFYCQTWQAFCPGETPIHPCQPPGVPTGNYGLHFRIFHGVPPQIGNPEAEVRIESDNAAIRVKVHRYGLTTSKNIYFQNDSPDGPQCDRTCTLPSPMCPTPPCEFGGECCPACTCNPATCPGSDPQDPCAGCNVMLNPNKTCGCEVETKVVTVGLPVNPLQGEMNPNADTCQMPDGGGCDNGPLLSDWCAYLSPSKGEGGVHFTITALNFSEQGQCWYTLPIPIRIAEADIVV